MDPIFPFSVPGGPTLNRSQEIDELKTKLKEAEVNFSEPSENLSNGSAGLV